MPATNSRTLTATLLREPTVHFLVVAGLIFGLYALINSQQENRLEINQSEIDARIFLQELSTGEALSEAQRQAVTSAYIEEQILVREALAMELDNDARIHDLLAQKMRHVLSGDIIQPADEELQAYYQANLERYRTMPAVTTDEVVFNRRDPLPDNLIEQLQNGAEPAQLLQLAEGNSSALRNANRLDLANIFSAEFAERVFAAPVGTWQGPFVSNRGQHWLRVTERTDARVPTLAEIIDRVRLDWVAEEEEARLQAEIDRLWDRYTIIINDGGGG